MTWRDDDEELKAVLKRAVPPQRETEPVRDLWPAMARRLDDETRAGVPWFDWILAAAAILWLLLFPEAMFPVLYHF